MINITREKDCVKYWLKSVEPQTASGYEAKLNEFMLYLKNGESDFKEATPAELIQFQKEMNTKPDDDKYIMLELINDWINSARQKRLRIVDGVETEVEEGYRYGSMKSRLSALRSFFKTSRAALPPNERKLKADIPPVGSLLTVEDIKQVLDRSKLNLKTAFIVMFQSGLDQNCFERWNKTGYRNMMEQINAGEKIITITIGGRKGTRNEVLFYTFFGGDALELMKEYLKVRGDQDGGIINNQFGEPLTFSALKSNWLRRINEAGLGAAGDDSQTGRGLHQLRENFRTLWTMSGATGAVAESMMGHTIDKLGYDQIGHNVNFMKAEFKKVLPYLNILSDGRAFGLVSAEKIETIEKDLRKDYNDLMQKYMELMEVVETKTIKPEVEEMIRMLAQELKGKKFEE